MGFAGVITSTLLIYTVYIVAAAAIMAGLYNYRMNNLILAPFA
jgi:hypothetical protein